MIPGLLLAALLAGSPAALQRTTAPSQIADAFDTSCRGEAAAAVRTGIELLFLLEHEQARGAFERAGSRDPGCAIAWWGQAVAWLQLPNGDPGRSAEDRARAALARAAQARHASDRERAYIETTSHLLEPPTTSYATRLHAFGRAARALASRNPEGGHPTLLVALAHLSLSSAPADMGQREAATAIVLRLGDVPENPAAASLLVRARTNAADAESGRGAASLVLRTRPSSPRALQAAARLFHLIGDWEDAVAAGEAAIQVAGGIGGPALLQDGRWPEHPLPWLVHAEASAGQFAAARRRLSQGEAHLRELRRSADPLVALRLRALLDVGWSRLRRLEMDWRAAPEWREDVAAAADELAGAHGQDMAAGPLSSNDRSLLAEAEASRAWVAGLQAARAAWPRGEPEPLAAARAAIARLDRLASAQPVPPRFELLRTEVQAAVSAALEAREELALLEAHLTGLTQRLRATAEEVGGSAGSDALCGDLHMQLRDWSEANRCYAGALVTSPRRARVLLGEARALRRLDQQDRAARAAAAFLDAWKAADPGRPELAEARDLAAGRQ